MTIADKFAEFISATHDDLFLLPLVQVTETRRAFFAGAWAVLCALESEEMSLLTAEMAEECRQFKADVLAGKA